MKIGITGSFGTGKTTLSKLVAGRKKYKLLSESPLQAFQIGLSMNKQADTECEVYIFGKQIEMEINAKDNYVADKCFIDLFAYAEYLFPEDKSLLDVLEKITDNAVKKYDIIIYLPSGEFPIEDDGLRPIDVGFQKAVDKNILDYLLKNKIKYYRVVGDKESRYKQVLGLIAQVFLIK